MSKEYEGSITPPQEVLPLDFPLREALRTGDSVARSYLTKLELFSERASKYGPAGASVRPYADEMRIFSDLLRAFISGEQSFYLTNHSRTQSESDTFTTIDVSVSKNIPDARESSDELSFFASVPTTLLHTPRAAFGLTDVTLRYETVQKVNGEKKRTKHAGIQYEVEAPGSFVKATIAIPPKHNMLHVLRTIMPQDVVVSPEVVRQTVGFVSQIQKKLK